jgi:Skp family chaperone for outer membrane proteins
VADDLINVKLDDVKALARALQHYGEKMKQANKEASNAIARAHWHDKQKDQFETRYRDFQRRINSFVDGEIKEMSKSLNRLASDLDHIRSRRM